MGHTMKVEVKDCDCSHDGCEVMAINVTRSPDKFLIVGSKCGRCTKVYKRIGRAVKEWNNGNFYFAGDE